MSTLPNHGHNGHHPSQQAPIQYYIVIQEKTTLITHLPVTLTLITLITLTHTQYPYYPLYPLLLKKNDHYRPMPLANVLYKLWASCLAILAMDYIEANKIISPEQEGFRPGRSCSRAITHMSLCIEDAHTHTTKTSC